MIVDILDTQSSSQLCAVVSFFVAGEDHCFSSRSGCCSSSADGLQGRSWGVCMYGELFIVTSNFIALHYTALLQM